MLKRNTHFYLFCDAETMFVAKPEAERAGFKFWKPLVWDKKTIGMGYHYRARYEFILFFEKGKRRLNDLGIADVIIGAAHPSRLSGREAAGGLRGADQPELACRASSSPIRSWDRAASASRRCRLGRRFRGTDLNPEAVRLTADRLRAVRRRPRAAGSAASGEARPARAHRTQRCDAAPIRQPRSRRTSSQPLRPARAEGLPRDPRRQVDHRQEPLHRRLLRPRGRQHGVRHRVQVPGLGRHGRREDSLRARRPRRRCRWPAASPTPARASPTACCTCSAPRRARPTACRTDGQTDSSAETRELDHLLAAHFGWWDVLIGTKRPV